MADTKEGNVGLTEQRKMAKFRKGQVVWNKTYGFITLLRRREIDSADIQWYADVFYEGEERTVTEDFCLPLTAREKGTR